LDTAFAVSSWLAYANGDAYGHSNRHVYCHLHAIGEPYPYFNRNADANTATDAHTQVWANGEAASHSRAPPIRSKGLQLIVPVLAGIDDSRIRLIIGIHSSLKTSKLY